MSLFIGVSLASDQKNYSPNKPVDKVNKSLSVVERKVRGAAVKVMTGGGHGSGTVIQYKDLTLVLTAKHVADGNIGSSYLISNENEQRNSTCLFVSFSLIFRTFPKTSNNPPEAFPEKSGSRK